MFKIPHHLYICIRCRPIAGHINFCPLALESEEDDNQIITVAMHELTHTLVRPSVADDAVHTCVDNPLSLYQYHYIVHVMQFCRVLAISYFLSGETLTVALALQGVHSLTCHLKTLMGEHI